MHHAYSVFIGRFQPFHTIHLEILQKALEESERVILVVGSARAAPSVRNPFSYEERVAMIKSALSTDEAERVDFVGVRDYYYNENAWVTEIQRKVSEIAKGETRIALVGAFKDSTSYYLQLFPQWEFLGVECRSKTNSTDIRHTLFSNPEPEQAWSDHAGTPWSHNLPDPIANWIQSLFIGSPHFESLCAEFDYLQEYKTRWADAPFPPTFLTTDAVVIKSGHVLVVRRRVPPGKNLLALPGGFVRQGELIQDAALRELKEETRIGVDKPILERNIQGTRVFDFPTRSERGRTISHAFHIDLGRGELPKVKGGDDAKGAFWMPLMDLGINEPKFFEDHAHIIFHFMNE